MINVSSSSLWFKDLTSILKVAWKQLLAISILIGFLVFILNIFLSISMFLKFSVAPDLREKLGMFFFIQDVPGNEHLMYKEIMELKENLENADMDVKFLSKQDGLDYMQTKLPLVKEFENYGIENPIPATLYVMFDSEEKYEILKTLIIDHKNIIANIDVLDKWKTLKQQENRNVTYLNLTNFIVIVSYFLVIILCLIIFIFLAFLLDNIFQRFRKDLYIKKLLGATRLQVTKSFMLVSLVVLIVALLFSFLLISGSLVAVHYYVLQLFGMSLLWYIWEHFLIFGWVLWVEFLALIVVSMLVSYGFVNSLNKTLGR